jgi:hypothetical protein
MKIRMITMLSLIATCLAFNTFAMEEKKSHESTDKKDNATTSNASPKAPRQKKKLKTSIKELEAENRRLKQQLADAEQQPVTIATSGLITSAVLTTIIPAAKNNLPAQPNKPNEIIISYDPNSGIHPEYQR